jgi:hypothetical protein
MKGLKCVLCSNWTILLMYTLLAVVMTYPAVAQLSTHLIGDTTDVYINPWANYLPIDSIGDGQAVAQADSIPRNGLPHNVLGGR